MAAAMKLRLYLPLFMTAALALAVTGLAAPPRPPAEQLRGDLDAILARSEYRQADTGWLQAALIRALRAISQWFQQHVGDRLDAIAEHAPVVYWTVVAVVFAMAALLIYHIYLTMRSAFGPGRRRRRAEKARPELEIENEPQTLRKRAETEAAAGRFAEALRYLYLALIHHLDRREVLRYDRSRTNHEYLRQARQHPAILDPLRKVTRLAERAWYGHYGLGRREYEQARDLVQLAWQEADDAAAL